MDFRTDKLLHGGDYNPEQWLKRPDILEKDIDMLEESGCNVVSLGIFSWSTLEPEEGVFHFEWLQEIIDKLYKRGISTILATPSGARPKWMADKYPEVLRVDETRHRALFGFRHNHCYTSPVYREKVHIINKKLAQEVATHPGVILWHISNEYGGECHCPLCQEAFRNWLKEKYGTIDNLNKTYGTTFWSQIYRSFDELIIPKAGACYDTCHDTQGQNPALLLDYYRFCSDSVIDFTKESVKTIREYSDLPITSNLLDAAINSGTGIDYFKLSKEFDFVTWDNYIEFQWGKAKPETVSRDHALLRSYKKKPFWVMEQQSGPCGWSKMGPTPTPGKLRLWTYQSVANGADTVVYFRWRACPFGTEELWHGILNHDGKPNRRYAEISQVGAEMEELSKSYQALMPRARVAIIKSFDSEWSQSIHRQVEGLYYDSLLLDYYRPFWNMGIPVDFVTAEEELDGYDLVLAPMLMMVSDEGKKNIESYAQAGGKILFSFRSGIKDMYNNMLTETVPGAFADLAGVEVEDYDPLLEKTTATTGVFGNGMAHMWCDIVKPVTAKILGRYTSDFYAGEACMTVNQTGKGEVYYLGCDLDEKAMKMLAVYLGRKAGIDMDLYKVDGVEVVDATDGTNDALFILNYNDHSVIVSMEQSYENMITHETVENVVELKPYDVAILKEAN